MESEEFAKLGKEIAQAAMPYFTVAGYRMGAVSGHPDFTRGERAFLDGMHGPVAGMPPDGCDEFKKGWQFAWYRNW